MKESWQENLERLKLEIRQNPLVAGVEVFLWEDVRAITNDTLQSIPVLRAIAPDLITELNSNVERAERLAEKLKNEVN